MDLNREEKRIITKIIQLDNRIMHETRKGTSDYILLANRAAKIWTNSEVSRDKRFRKVITISDPILDWDILACKVGTNLKFEVTKEGNTEWIHGEPITRGQEIEPAEISLKFTKERQPDTILTEIIFNNDEEN